LFQAKAEAPNNPGDTTDGAKPPGCGDSTDLEGEAACSSGPPPLLGDGDGGKDVTNAGDPGGNEGACSWKLDGENDAAEVTMGTSLVGRYSALVALALYCWRLASTVIFWPNAATGLILGPATFTLPGTFRLTFDDAAGVVWGLNEHTFMTCRRE